MKIGDSERKTQNQVIKFFKEKLGYNYIGNLQDTDNENIRQNTLSDWLISQGYSKKIAEKAIEELKKTSSNLQQGLYHANKETYSMLKYGAKIRESYEDAPKTVYFIDFENPDKNNFSIAEEVTITDKQTKRPDLIIYVNGIALAVIELKKSTVSVSNGIRQNLTNQNSKFIEKFFTTIQLCMAGNTSEGLRYGTILTPEKKYLEWKDDGFKEHQTERDTTDILIEKQSENIKDEKLIHSIYAMFYKKRFLDIVHNFIIFDKGIKKICRYNQYYAVKRAQHRIKDKHSGGIIWHTQGSGKSLTMVWLSKWILANNPQARVLIVTDREELDEQIEKTFIGVDEQIIRTKSGKDLLERLNLNENRLICSLVHKFGRHESDTSESDYEKYIEELKNSLPKDFEAKGDIVVFVDECHRTQSGKLHNAMKTILPKAIFIGFTGTPLLKKDKKTSLETFGSYIHTYKFNEGVEDGVILDLRYDARYIPQNLSSPEKIDAWFDAKTAGLTPTAKAKLKSYWGNLQKVFSSKSRLDKIANDIIFDFGTKARLMDGNGNAILVSDSVYSACRYYEIFQSKNFKECAVISSYIPMPSDLRTDTVSNEEDTEAYDKYNTYLKMIGIDTSAESKQITKKVQAFEAEAKRKFVEEPNNMKLLIVVDKLLTGFDAPKCTYLYIDKSMRDHGLFQAICRVNRLDDDSKNYGYIVDYKELFGNLKDAMNKYTSGAFEAYDKEDVDGLLKDITSEAKKDFNNTLDELEGLCEGVKSPRKINDYGNYFCGESGKDDCSDENFTRSREKLYKLVKHLIRAYAELKPRMNDAGYSENEQKKIESRVKFYVYLSNYIVRMSGDYIDLKAYEPSMRYLIDTYISADESSSIGDIKDFTLLDFIKDQEKILTDNKNKEKQQSAAEAIENNIRKNIVERMLINPAYFGKMSEILEKVIEDRRNGVITYIKLLDRYKQIAAETTNPEDNSRYPKSIRESPARRSFYDNYGEDEGLAILIDDIVRNSKKDGFRNNPQKEKIIKYNLVEELGSKYEKFKNDEEIERLYKLIDKQEEY